MAFVGLNQHSSYSCFSQGYTAINIRVNIRHMITYVNHVKLRSFTDFITVYSLDRFYILYGSLFRGALFCSKLKYDIIYFYSIDTIISNILAADIGWLIWRFVDLCMEHMNLSILNYYAHGTIYHITFTASMA